MCQNAIFERSEQIDRCVQNGMPEKIVKSVIYTLKKRIKRAENISLETQETKIITNTFPNEPKWESQFPLSTNNTSAEELLNKVAKPINMETSKLKIPKMCGRFRQQSKKDQNAEIQTSNPADITGDSTKEKPKEAYIDALNVGTVYTKLVVDYISRTVENWKQTKAFILLTKTTQPAHFIAICVLSVVLLTIWPDLIDSGIDRTTKTTKAASNTLATIAYLGAFATHFGAQIWMTFISGLSLFFSLPRHIFGQCQQILFPRYFTFNAVLSIGMLVIFVKYFIHTWSLAIAVQFATLIINPAIELTVRLYFVPPMLYLMLEKYKIEDSVGSGKEVGRIVQGDLSECPHYLRIHKAFRRMHMMVAIGNMTVLAASCTQLYFLASKIRFEIS